MNRNPDDIVQVFSGPLIDAETYQGVLAEAGIESKVVGADLAAGLGSAFPGSIELWVHRHDTEKAAAAIKLYEDDKGRRGPAQQHGHPKSDHLPKHGGHTHREPHVKQDPATE